MDDLSRFLVILAAGAALVGMYILLKVKIDHGLKTLLTKKLPDIDPPVMEIPKAGIEKEWKVDGVVMGSLNVSCAGRTTKEALDGVAHLLTLSAQHDGFTLEAQKEKPKEPDRSVG